MIPRFQDLKRFISAPCSKCYNNQNMFYDKRQNIFYCNECYSTIPFNTVKEEDIYFDTATFVNFLQGSPMSPLTKRLIFLYMEDIYDETKDYYMFLGKQMKNLNVAWLRKKYESYQTA